jgi:hypothetical protein
VAAVERAHPDRDRDVVRRLAQTELKLLSGNAS